MVHVGVHNKGAISLSSLLDSIKSDKNFRKAGAIGIFIGVVRGESAEGEAVEKLKLEAYEENANKVLKDICKDLSMREGVVDAQIHHLLGEFNVGEDLVYVTVAGAHRYDIFPILQEAIERYKKEAPIFKKEYIIDERGETRSFWIGDGEENIDLE